MSERTAAKAVQHVTGWSYVKALQFLRDKRADGTIATRRAAGAPSFKEAAVALAKEAVAGKPKCETCDGLGEVAVAWPSGYPHACPCPACRPDQPCGCGAPNCPSPAAIAEWKKEHQQP